MGAEAKLYLQEHSIPQLFEGLMTGLIYNRPANPLEFLEEAIAKIKANPDEGLSWDMFIDKGLSSNGEDGKMVLQRSPSVIKAADVAQIPHVPIVLFMGGPGGGKTRHAARVSNALADQGLIHICMPDVIRNALAKYKDHYSEWKSANDHYLRGELIPNHLALALVKAEMGRHPNAAAFFLEGFPREARQVEDFERQVKSVNMALILDYDEKTLRDHMEKRGMGMEIIDQRIKEFKQKTLPSAKYFDDQKLLHLIPGEKDDQTIFERMRDLVKKAMETGVPVLNSNPPSQAQHRSPEPLVVSPPAAEINGVVGAVIMVLRSDGYIL
uniref:Zeta_toxin domain-containing protein n=1 Tax=Heterorhabditis bacteriophora TaxID=37862 RepID=A0A1I7WSG5_HETBA